MKIGIVDDEADVRERLFEYLNRYAKEAGRELSVVCFSSGEELLSAYRPVFDILIFDIDMPGMNGMDAARKLRETDEEVTILFVTHMAQYAINGYEVGAVDYIIKPIGYYEFALKFAKALKRVNSPEKRMLALNATDGLRKLKVEDIYCVEARGHYLVYHTKEGEVTVRAGIGEHEVELRQYHFLRSHRSFLINLAHLENVQAQEITVAGERLPLGRTYKDRLLMEFMRYMKGAGRG